VNLVALFLASTVLASSPDTSITYTDLPGIDYRDFIAVVGVIESVEVKGHMGKSPSDYRKLSHCQLRVEKSLYPSPGPKYVELVSWNTISIHKGKAGSSGIPGEPWFITGDHVFVFAPPFHPLDMFPEDREKLESTYRPGTVWVFDGPASDLSQPVYRSDAVALPEYHPGEYLQPGDATKLLHRRVVPSGHTLGEVLEQGTALVNRLKNDSIGMDWSVQMPSGHDLYLIEAEISGMRNVFQEQALTCAVLKAHVVSSVPPGLEGNQEICTLNTFYLDEHDGKVTRVSTNSAWVFPKASYLLIVRRRGERTSGKTRESYLRYPVIEWAATIQEVPGGSKRQRQVVKEFPPKMPTVEDLRGGLSHNKLSFGAVMVWGPYDEVKKSLTARYAR